MGQELAKLNCRGYNDGLGGGTFIGLPPIRTYGKPALRDKIVPEVLSGKKLCALAITEAFAGSDVTGLRCYCKKVEGGWRVTGTKVLRHAFETWSFPSKAYHPRNGSQMGHLLTISSSAVAPIKESLMSW